MGRRTAVLGVLAFLSAPAFAKSISPGFYSGGRLRSLTVDQDFVVVGSAAARTAPKASILTDAEAARFAAMGLTVVPRAAARSAAEIVGLPVWFNKEKGAVGVLTDEVALKVHGAGADRVLAKFGALAVRAVPNMPGVFRVKFGSPMAALNAANSTYKTKGVVYSHPNFLIPKVWRTDRPAKARDDGEPFYGSQWHLENTGQFGGVAGADIHVKGAWEVTEGESDVVVAILDGGFETTHPDLDGAFFRNPSEVPGNGIDDDKNGYVDDVSGWNYWTDGNDPAGGILDDHGTAVSGLVGARKNGKGVVGTCPMCTLLPVALSWEIVEDAAAFAYVEALGADVITNSWGYPIGTPETDVLEDAMAHATRFGRDGKGAIILFAMNNLNQDDCISPEPDISSPEYVIAVSGASDMDVKVTGSAWGDCMEFLSPTWEGGRRGIATTDLTGRRGYNSGSGTTELPDPDYTNDFSGTSAATPISAGVFALMLSVNGDLTRNEALAMVLSSADKIQPNLADYNARTGFSKKYGYGRINAGRAVRAAELFRKYTRRERDEAGKTRAIRR